MNIKFYTLKFKTKDGEHTRASRRFRAIIPLKGMRKNDGQIENLDKATRDDIIVLAKDTSIKDGQFLLDNKIKFVFDICDDKWKTRKKKIAETYDFLCKNANLVVTSTPTLANIIRRHTGIHAHVITDPAERERKEPEFKNITNDTIIKFAYYGAGKNFEIINWNKIVNDLKVVHNNKIEIHVVIGRANKHLSKVQHLIEQKILFVYQWTYELQDQIVDDCHFVLLPIVNVNENISAKSPNRLIDGIQRGKLVLTNAGVNSYESFKNFSYFVSNFNYGEGLKYALNNKDEVLTNIKRGQFYIDQHHTPEIIGKKWIEIERLV